jgi:hypothetical protein
MALAQTHQPRRLLVVQRNRFVARSIARHLGRAFHVVDVAETPDEAERIQADPARTPTHVVCGENFGPACPRGTALIAGWRRTYPSLQRVVLATADWDLPETLDGVDVVLLKPCSQARLLAAVD